MAGVTLDGRDVDALTRFLTALSEPMSLEQLRRTVVEEIPSVVSSDLTAWNEVDPGSGRMDDPVIAPEPAALPGSSYETGAEIFATYVHEHPVLQHFLRTGDGRPFTISDFLTQEEFHATQLYQQFYSPMGVEEQMALQLPSPSPIVAITLHGRWKGYSERDRLLLNLMRPQIVQALRNAEALARLHRLRQALEQRIEESGEGLVLLDPADRVEYASPSALAILGRWLGDWSGPGLPDRLQDWVGREAGNRPPAPPWPLIMRRLGHQLTIRRLSTTGDEAIALLVSEEAPPVDVMALLAQLGLSPRQAEVLHLAIQGMGNGQIAARLHIAQSTVETHMSAAMAKLGVGSRTAAANLLHQAILGSAPEAEAAH